MVAKHVEISSISILILPLPRPIQPSAKLSLLSTTPTDPAPVFEFSGATYNVHCRALITSFLGNSYSIYSSIGED